MTAARILLVEHSPSMGGRTAATLRTEGFEVIVTRTALEALVRFRQDRPDIIILDLSLPRNDAADLASDFLSADHLAPVIVVAEADLSTRQSAALGAASVLVRPVRETVLLSAIRKARPFEVQKLARDNEPCPEMFGSSPAFHALRSAIDNAARSSGPVFLTGDSGTGKSLAADCIHRISGRAKEPFLTINCAALSGEAGAGALAGIEAAYGTVFLDHVCDLDPALRAQLLYLIENGGADRSMRIISATNRDPRSEVLQGRFRPELFHRLDVLPIHFPLLRDRERDVIDIANQKLPELAATESCFFTAVSHDVEELFLSLPWTGNVRELLNVLRGIATFEEGPIITLDMFSPPLLRSLRIEGSALPESAASCPEWTDKTLAEIERLVI